MRHSAFLPASVVSPILAGNLGGQETVHPTGGTFKVPRATAGDQRAGRYALADEGDNELGVMHSSSVVIPSWDDAENPFLPTLNSNFTSGSLVAMAAVALPSPSNPDIDPDHQLEYRLTGRSGDFPDTSGTLTSKTIEDGRREMAFDLQCGTWPPLPARQHNP